MGAKRLGVGIVGLEPGRSWAARSHVPAVRALSETFEIAGIANSSAASAERAAAETGLRAFADVAALVSAPEVDIVTVVVRVPAHFEIVKAAIGAGKHVYCEWPLAVDLAAAIELAALAREKGVLGVVGTQARVAPEIAHVRHLIADGFIGEVLSTTLVGRGGLLQGAGSIPSKRTAAYLLDRGNGANLLTIPVGHTLAALRDLFGEVAQMSSVLAVRQPMVRVLDTGETLPATSPDEVLLGGTFAGGMARRGPATGCSGKSAARGATSASPPPPAISRWCRFRLKPFATAKQRSGLWSFPPRIAPAGRKMR
jgi:predicted dehydrogenase